MIKALLIIDIQNDYFENGKMELVGSEKASKNAKAMLEFFRDKNLPIVHMQHIAASPTATFFSPDTDGVKINKNVEPKGDEKVIVKHYPNSFRETELLVFLKSAQIAELVVCGMMTHMCIDTTVRAAYDHGFKSIVIGDACATKDLELDGEKVNAKEVQIAYLAGLNGTFAEVKKTNDFIRE
ncbi:MAG: nicotinamidase-related amidase [Flavobacterium sp.]|jgi:nicotinamidase-related amidase